MGFQDRNPVRSYIRKFWRPFSLGTLTLALTNFFDILTPIALMKAIDAIVGKKPDDLGSAILLYFAFMVGAVSFRHQWRVHFGRFHHSVAEDIRNRLFRKYTELGPRFFEKNPTGELMSLMINDVNTFRMGVGPGMLILLDGIFLIAFIIPFMLSISVDWTWKTLILLPFIPFVIRFMEDRIAKASRINQDRLAAMSGYTQELVTGIRVVKGFAQESNRQKEFRRFSGDYAASCNTVARYDAFFEPALHIGVATGSAILLAWGSKDVLSGAVSLGTFVAFHEYIKRMIWPMAALGSGLSMLQQGRASYGRIAEVLATESEVEGRGTTKVEKFDSLEVRDLTFLYPGANQPALRNLSLTIRRGESVGIIGPVGSGKSTFVWLLSRIREAPAKSVFVNGVPIEEVAVSDWRRLLAITPQDPFLFSNNIEENILFGRRHLDEAKSNEIHADALAAADDAAIRSEIERLPSGFRAWLGEKGVNLSGGQRQRMTIARSLARATESTPAEVIVLDDSLSAVDAQTEAGILGQLKQARKDVTTIIVSHRIESIKNADRIYVFSDGQLEASGKHDELLSASATYRHLNRLQSQSSLTDAQAEV